MSTDPLQHDYGILLGVTAPILLDRVDKFRRLAKLLGPGSAAIWMEAQADRAEQSIVALGKKFNEHQR